MNEEKIAILVDSSTDVPADIIKEYGIYELPLSIIYTDKTYKDKVDITPEEVYDSLETEIPTTSLPTGEEILRMFDKIKEDGFKKVLVITISSGLSGTFNFIKLLAEDYKELEIDVIDTKNVSIGSGMVAILAAKNLASGMDYETLVKVTQNSVKNSKVFFCVSTLKYLQKGGRIGLVASILGEGLKLKPVITCNDEGIYHSVAKIFGRKESLQKAALLAEKFVKQAACKSYNIAIVNVKALDEANEIKDYLLGKLTNCKELIVGTISPALVVHTGPGLIGIGVQVID